MLSGQAPLCDKSPEAVKSYASEGTKLEPPPWTLDPDHSAWNMVNLCRAKKPKDRPDLAEVLDFLTHASRDPPVEWPLPPERNLPSSSFRSPSLPRLLPQPSPRSIPAPLTPVLSVSLIPSVQPGARSLLKCATVQMLAYQDDTGLRWKAMGGEAEKQGPGPKKRKTS